MCDRDVSILPTDHTIATCLVRNGYLPCSPFKPTVVITIHAVEFFRLSHLRCPHFSIQSYAKTLCDMHGVSIGSFTITYSVSPVGLRFPLNAGFRANSLLPMTCIYIFSVESSLLYKQLLSVTITTGVYAMRALHAHSKSRTSQH